MTSWAFDTLLWTGALIVAVLVVRRPVARWFGPGLAYALWLLPLARLVMPPLVLPKALLRGAILFKGFAPVATTPVPAAAGADTMVTTVTIPAEASFALPWALLLTCAWLGGAALFLLARASEYRTMRRDLLAGAVEVDRRDGVRLVETPAVAAPVAFGLRDKVIALPPRFLISGRLADRALAIEHELAHHRGRDLLANWLAQPVLALHWFNPLAWLAWNAMRRDQEAACDARVLAGSDPATRAAYARVIAGFAAGNRIGPRAALAAPMACPVLGDKSIVHRLRSLTMTDISVRRRRVGRWTLAAGAALALPLTATVVYAGQDEPAPPAAPAAPASPEAPAKKIEKHIVIVEHEDHADHDDAAAAATKKKLFEKRIERDGKTVVIRSDKPIDEAELEARLGKLDKLEKLDKLARAFGDNAPGEKRTVRKFIVHGDGHDAAEGEHRFAVAMRKCDDGQTLAEADSTRSDADDTGKKVDRTRFLLCGKPGLGKAVSLARIRAARDHIAASEGIASEMRSDILRQIDEAIARIESEVR